MKRLSLFVYVMACLFAIPSFAKEKNKPVRPAHDTSTNANLYATVWHCTFTVTQTQTTIASCTPGKFNNSRVFISIPSKKEHRTISNRLVKFLTGFYGHETYPYANAKSKKPVARPEKCQFELTHGTSSEPNDTAIIHAQSGTCPLLYPYEQFLFQDRLLDAANLIAYERGEVPGGLEEDNDE